VRPALVFGSAWSRWEDLGRLEDMIGAPWPGLVVGTNESCMAPDMHGRAWERNFHILATLHSEKVAKWRLARRELVASLGRSPLWDHYEVWSANQRNVVDRHYSPDEWLHSSSGGYAVGITHDELDCYPVILCGVRMDAQKNAFRGKPWTAYRKYLSDWKDNLDRIRGRVFSMSGWTGAMLGEPTQAVLGTLRRAA
jgi:hypothetical protein